MKNLFAFLLIAGMFTMTSCGNNASETAEVAETPEVTVEAEVAPETTPEEAPAQGDSSNVEAPATAE